MTTAGQHGPPQFQVPQHRGAYNPEAEEVQAAGERLAQALEAAAAKETSTRARNKLLRKARKVRRKHTAEVVSDQSSDDGKAAFRGPAGAVKAVGCGLVLLCTTPVYLAGTIVEGTGVMLKASGMIVRGIGMGMKKTHLVVVDKLKIQL